MRLCGIRLVAFASWHAAYVAWHAARGVAWGMWLVAWRVVAWACVDFALCGFLVWAWRASVPVRIFLVLPPFRHVRLEGKFLKSGIKKEQPTNPRRPKTRKKSPSDAQDETN
jgi:hypothetical protein